jgi:hypothetical protein
MKKTYLLELAILILLTVSCKKDLDLFKIEKIDSVIAYQDVRFKDLTSLESQLDTSLIQSLTFNENTIWPARYKDFAASMLERGKNPGLGIKALHQMGITGKDVKLAIIDQNLCLDYHPEFNGKIIKYKDFGCNASSAEGSMHAPAVASLLLGNNIGVAPDVRIYFAAVPSWNADARYYADALNWIIAENAKLPKEDKIRAVSVSAAPSGSGSPFTKNNSLWDEAFQMAQDSGILVFDCTNKGITAPGYYDINSPESCEKFKEGWPQTAAFVNSVDEKIFVPTSYRTVAEHYKKGYYSYQYTGQGGLSWGIPYMTGVLALGWQVNPSLSNKEIVDILFSTAYKNKTGNKIINPQAFIEKIKSLNKN